jgi:hypothetical protein
VCHPSARRCPTAVSETNRLQSRGRALIVLYGEREIYPVAQSVHRPGSEHGDARRHEST